MTQKQDGIFSAAGPIATQDQIDALRAQLHIPIKIATTYWWSVILCMVLLSLYVANLVWVASAVAQESLGSMGNAAVELLFLAKFLNAAAAFAAAFVALQLALGLVKTYLLSFQPLGLDDADLVTGMLVSSNAARNYRQRVLAVRKLLKGDIKAMRSCKDAEDKQEDRNRAAAGVAERQATLDSLNLVD